MDIRTLQRVIVDGLEDVKGQNIVVFNTEHLSPLFERVIIASGTSNRQTKALAASVRDAVKAKGEPSPRLEGEANGEWIIVDCGSAVVHLMQPSIREYYHLEEIWGDKPVKMKLDGGAVRLVKAESEPEARPRGASVKKSPATRPAAKKVVARKSVGLKASAQKLAAQKAPARRAASPAAPVRAAGKTSATRAPTKRMPASVTAKRGAAGKAASAPIPTRVAAKPAPVRAAGNSAAARAAIKRAPAKKVAVKAAPVQTIVVSPPARKSVARKSVARTAAPARKGVTRTVGVKAGGEAPKAAARKATVRKPSSRG